MRYFVYGTLRDADVRAAVLGAKADGLSTLPATLPGYRVVCVPGATYPTLHRDARSRADGLVIAPVDAATAWRLAVYEGDGYCLRFVRVRSRTGALLVARCFRPRGRPRACAAWELARWQRRHKRAHLRRLRD